MAGFITGIVAGSVIIALIIRHRLKEEMREPKRGYPQGHIDITPEYNVCSLCMMPLDPEDELSMPPTSHLHLCKDRTACRARAESCLPTEGWISFN